MAARQRGSAETAVLSAHPALSFLPRPLIAQARLVTFEKGDALFRAGDHTQDLYFVFDGELVLVRHSRNGQEVVLQRTRSGFFAEASIESPRYHCDGIAKERSRVCLLPMGVFRQALTSDPSFRAGWTKLLAGEIRRLRTQCERLALRGIEERIVHYIESEGSNGAIALDRSLKAWALDLGVTHEALYRALARMTRSGLLARGDRHLRLAGAKDGIRHPKAGSLRRMPR
jgi:CRP/FNR family transcriptional regulator, dissimilatory nitrate respiration regulator